MQRNGQSPAEGKFSEVAPVVVDQHTGGVLVREVYEGEYRRGDEQLNLHPGGDHPDTGRAAVA